jgi:orotate phosphoribosyltransferase
VGSDTDAERRHLAQQLRARAFLTGRFTLRSGATSGVYWDKYRFEADPAVLAAVARGLAALLPPAYDRLAGLELVRAEPLPAGVTAY